MRFEFNEKNHRYTLDGKPLTGVTTVLSVISKPALIGWSARMAVEHIAKVLAETNSETSIDWSVVLEEARTAHTRKRDTAAQAGTDIHKWIEDWIKAKTGEEQPMLPEDKVARKQAGKFVEWVVQNDIKFLESEKRMYSEELWLGGTTDAVAEIKGKKYVVDFKTQSKMWDRTPFLQIAAYRLLLESMGETGYDGGLIVLLPKTGGLETHYSYKYEEDKEAFLAALKLYRAINIK